MQVKFKHLRNYVIECEEKHCGNCNKRDSALCRLFPRYPRKGYSEQYILEFDGLHTLRTPECIKYGVPLQVNSNLSEF
jgi:hypothetical protein